MNRTWMIIAGMTVVTALPRILPILLLSGRKFPRIAERWLSLIAPAILSALLLPELLIDRGGLAPSLSFYNIYLFAALPTFLVAWKAKSLFGAVVTGIVTVALARLLAWRQLVYFGRGEVSLENFDELRLKLGGVIGGGAVEYHDTLTSTQLRARELACAGAEKAVVIAGEQTSGRGRIARHWESPKGSGLYFSVMFRPALPAEAVHLVNVAAALSVAGAVRSLLSLELELKWPNDLLVLRESKYRKVCGILSESAARDGAIDYCVTGIGLNLYALPGLPPDIKDRVGWLCEDEYKEGGGGEKIDRANLLFLVVENFFRRLDVTEREGVRLMLSEYREKCASIGRVVKVETGAEILTGLCAGIGDDGELLLETSEGVRRFHAADVTHAGLEERR